MNVGELKAALKDVPDDVEVEYEAADSIFGYYFASEAYLTTKMVGLATSTPKEVPVFRIEGLGC